MDELDTAILAELQRDGRQTNRELAERIGIAASTCLERVRSLRANGVIEGFHAEVNLAAIGRPVQALINVRLHPKIREAVEGFREYITALPETVAIFVVSGGDDFIIQVAVRDTGHLRDFVLDHVSRHRNIADVRTSLVYDHIRRTSLEVLEPELPSRPRTGRKPR
ncbi:Lrp/AsnC family transcriptional regulator [Nonomuraea roseoviolacea subsp. roseoviolacea]|uniref:DNA-binding Lrp family transcriptional regulator n=1 Tax=Nonomuraea roseoviolacea subsp. carminata TaxID=160689 RepID=A0ABT1JZ20_9ACTN|nr:Lrp/AsnC family transcriptional regulator [Nonomuraea roseoviolacea]MCP2346955.1 DNA-binding Lrp family transcriptional regulator [Nonomuraea roseoviolacea subsp. carminata]